MNGPDPAPADQPFDVGRIRACFEGAIPAVLCTAAADGTPNICWVSRAHEVDAERIALSNQFLSKTAKNLAVNPRASLLLLDPVSFDEFRLELVYERTERRGHVFERLRADIEALAALEGMQDVFQLRAADIFRVVDIEQIAPNHHGVPAPPPAARHTGSRELTALAELTARMARCGSVDDLLDAMLEGLDQLLGYHHTFVLLAEPDGRRLSTLASRGFEGEGIGAEVDIGTGLLGAAAQRCTPMRTGNLRQVAKYSRSLRLQYEQAGGDPRQTVTVPGLPDAESVVAVPAQARGELVAVIVAESREPVAFGPPDEEILGVVARMLAQALVDLRSLEDDAEPSSPRRDEPVTGPVPSAGAAPARGSGSSTAVRFYEVDGSTFLDGDYLIKGVAGRILWALLRHHDREGRTEFTNKELRLDPSLDLPGFKDNLESRLLLLKRRLDEHGAPIRIERTGRGRFRLDVSVPLRLETEPAPA